MWPDMRLMITKTEAGGVATLKVDGNLTHECIAELEKACASADGQVDLDLSQLMSADAEALEALKNLFGSGARLVAASPYIALLLKIEEA